MSRRSGIMLCYPFEEKRLNKWGYPVFVQPKLDGDRCVARPDDNGYYRLWSSEQNEFTSVPHINEALNNLALGPLVLDGELYKHGLPHSEIHARASRTVNQHEDSEALEFHVFDIMVEDTSQLLRISALENIYMRIHKDSPIKTVLSVSAGSLEGVINLYDKWCDLGYEGIIVRHPMAPYEKKRSTWIMKFKPKKDDHYMIIGWQEEVDKYGVPKGRIGALVCQGDDGTPFNVGTGLTDKQRHDYWQMREWFEARVLMAHVQYQHLTPGKGVPRFPVLVRVVDPVVESQQGWPF